MRQAETRRIHNNAVRSSVRTAVRKFREAVASGDPAEVQAQFKSAAAAIDKAEGKGVIGAASRRISRLARAANTVAAK
jgi:small subunit ribosomal protein S20